MPHGERPGNDRAHGRQLRVLLALALLLAVAGCADEKSVVSSPVGGSCMECHTSKDALIASAEPEEEPGEDPGEG